MSRLYVYALLGEPLRPARIAGRWIDFLRVGRIYAAAERRSRPPILSESGLRLQHRIVVQLGRRSEAILPVRFGAWLEPDELTHTIARHRRTLHRALEVVRNREQMTVRIFAPAQRSRNRSAPASGTAYLQARRPKSTVAVTAVLDGIRLAVRPIAFGESMDVSSRGLTAVHHLIDRGRGREYRRLVARSIHEALDERHAVSISGPWPPFAFVPDIWP